MSEKQPPMIGEFSGPPNNQRRTPDLQRNAPPVEDAPRATADAPNPASAGDTDAASRALEEQEHSDEPPSPEEKADTYLKGLEAVGVSQDEARQIMSDVLFGSGYQCTYNISREVQVVFRTRNYEDTQRTMRLIENEAPQMPMHVTDLLSRFNAAASLERFGETVFEFPTRDSSKMRESEKAIEDAFYKRLDFVMQLATPVVHRLMTHLATFDSVLFAVFAEGAPEDF